MTDSYKLPVGGIPEGETDPTLIYIAVGQAIHVWEGMEEALARLYLKMKSIPDSPSANTDYGSKYRVYAARMAALQSAASNYFTQHPDQEKEGKFQAMTKTIDELAIERHRVAHGHISMVAEFNIDPTGEAHKKAKAEGGLVKVSAPVKYRWGAPFYSTGSLRTDPFGKNAKNIDEVRELFGKMHDEVHYFTESLAP